MPVSVNYVPGINCKGCVRYIPKILPASDSNQTSPDLFTKIMTIHEFWKDSSPHFEFKDRCEFDTARVKKGRIRILPPLEAWNLKRRQRQWKKQALPFPIQIFGPLAPVT